MEEDEEEAQRNQMNVESGTFEIVPTDQQIGEIKERMTTPYMTKYERARILGTRALQIRYDCDDMLDNVVLIDIVA